MLLKESDLRGSTEFDFIESLDSLNESEMAYTAQMVPVRHIDRLNRNLIQLEEFVKYGSSNGITNGHKAIGAVCEASMIDNDSTIGFVVNEASLYEDDELVEISQSLKESGYDLFISPVYCEGTVKENLNSVKHAVCGVGNRAGKNMLRIKNHVQNAVGTVQSAVSNTGDTVKTLANKYSAAKLAVKNFADKAAKAPESFKQSANNALQKAKDTAMNLKNKLMAAKQGS
mgnify:CR=1 FL=1